MKSIFSIISLPLSGMNSTEFHQKLHSFSLNKEIRRDGFSFQEYHFVKGKTLGIIIGGWCLFVTAFCCVTGMYSTDTYTMILNVVTPIVLLALGLILPEIRKRQDVKENAGE